jgi:16S rRNA (cytidine1402-2'-O)-methyltransferase
MARQKSQPTGRKPRAEGHHSQPVGTLYVVGTPIGFPDDLTIRARTILTQVSIIAAETPLATQSLLAHHGITATITSYGSRQYEEKIAVLIHHLKEGHDVALVSDSGMPVIYDPGRLLITAAQQAGFAVSVIPGPSALTAAVALSGYSGDRIIFDGRLPRARRLLDVFFTKLKKETGTTVMFASTRSLRPILKSLAQVLPDRLVTVAVNMTRTGERTYHGCGRTLLKQIHLIASQSEVTVVLSGVQKNEIRKKTRNSKND